ncbi:dihydrodipicolinate synthase family protein [Niabella beijingensis]|uniref:dihydrodipicolinate synthase family protein n=1 Tax=Niabella beijingensis TaxID=2872700 RepID=UPI001CC1BEE2|nr:dihydrodipicolinate synthase family protein [Niabella beijingensis]MBZ4190908.1 dihydrodipicolinate synthase family protein [Niabella beijingensis]
MQPLKANEIVGTWGTLLLPIGNDDSIDQELLSSEIQTLIAAKVNGIYSNGTAGEFYNQTEEEFELISQLLADACNAAEMPFQIGCSHTGPKQTLERIKRIRPLKPGAIQVILSDWFPPSRREILKFLEGVCNAAEDIGIVLYNPPHAKVILSPSDYAAILKEGIPLVGCKTAGGDAQWYTAMSALQDFSVFIPGHHLATGIRQGAHGSYSNVACLHPAIARSWYEDMKTDMEKALLFEVRIRQFMEKHIVPLIKEEKYSNQAVDKLLAWITGWAAMPLRLRWPYSSVTEEEALRVRDHCRDLLPEFFETVTA